MIADLTCNGWEYDEPHVKLSGASGGNPYAGGATRIWEVTVAIDGSIVDQGAADDDVAERCSDVVRATIDKWDTNIEAVATGWQEYQIPRPSDFDDAIAAAGRMVEALSSGTGSTNSALGNPHLEALGNMRDLFPNAAAAPGLLAIAALSGVVAAWASGPVGAVAGGLATSSGFLGTAVAALEAPAPKPQGADDSAREAMGKHRREVAGARLGWVQPHQDPPPPPPGPRRGGVQELTY